METLALEHLPAPYDIHLALFRNVENAGFLHQQLLARNADFEYAFVDASMILSRVHLLSAIFKATNSAVHGTLKTPNVHSEIVASLSPSNNIAEAYRRYGVQPTTKNLLVAKITIADPALPPSAQRDLIWRHLEANVQGQMVPAVDENIFASTDLTKVKKYYKLNGLGWLDSIRDKNEMRREMEMLIVGALALRGI